MENQVVAQMAAEIIKAFGNAVNEMDTDKLLVVSVVVISCMLISRIGMAQK